MYRHLPGLLIAAYLSFSPVLVSGYSFFIQNLPQQCHNLSITILGPGKPPFSALVVPFGATPLSNGVEARRILNQQFNGINSTVSFQLPYPTNSQFVVIVSDTTGFGSGGTSGVTTVQSSSDATCFNPNQAVVPAFFLNVQPPNQLVQCTPTRIWWNSSAVSGTPNFLGVIPAGISFAIPQGTITDVPSQGTGFSWTPSIRGGTTMLLVGGDNRGQGDAGSALFNIQTGLNPDNSCINDNSPSSTPGTPAGAPTGTPSPDNSSEKRSSTNVGAIVGGVIGGVAGLIAILLICLFFIRRQQFHSSSKERPVDLLQGDEGDDAREEPQLPQYYQPEPFIVPDPTEVSSAGGQENLNADASDPTRYSQSRRDSRTTMSDLQSPTPDLLGTGLTSGSSSTPSTSRKSAGGPRTFHPVNIIQHDDAGPSAGQEDGTAETIELPPAYTNLRK